MVKRLPAMQETQVQSLGGEDPLEKAMATHVAMATHSSTLAWKIPWTEEPGRLQSHGVTEIRTQLSDFIFFFFRLVITFLPRSKRLLISYTVSTVLLPFSLLTIGAL